MINSDGTGEQRLTAGTEDDWGAMDWQRVPVTSIDDDQDGHKKVQEDADHHDIDYEVYDNEDLTVDGKVDHVIVHANGTLKGHGGTGDADVEADGHLAPGNSPGCISTGNLNLAAGSALDEELGGTTACSGYDQTNVTGTVTLGGATLNTTLYGGFVPAVGNAFTIISNDGTDAVSGTFNGLAEGATFTVTGVTYTITYQGGDGNDVVLTVKAVDASQLPKVPNTGMHLVAAHPVMVVGTVSAMAVGMVALSRYGKPRQHS